MIKNFNDFVAALLEAGFSMGGGGGHDGTFSVISWNWDEAPPYDTPVSWHTGDPETDPWEWRMRVLEERHDIAYAKLFFKKSGYITKEWYPYFLAARRGRKTLADEYEDGTISRHAKLIYDLIVENEALPLHDIKRIGGFPKGDASKVERALVELQMKMHITMCGRQRKRSKTGEEYGWQAMVFCTAERFFGAEIFEKASSINAQEAIAKITDRMLYLNPSAESKKTARFITG